MRRLTLKRLTRSDLSFFESQYRKDSTSKQKAINLNADVFVDQMYPGLSGTFGGNTGRIAVNLIIYGPDAASEFSIARKIVRSPGSKNWRLNGELVPDPDLEAGRFERLEPDDLALIEFEGESTPTTVRLALVSRHLAADALLHSRLDALIPEQRSMVAITHQKLEQVLRTIVDLDDHPLSIVLSDAAIEDVALGGARGVDSIRRKKAVRKMSLETLQQARKNAEEVGQRGEEYVNAFLAQQRRAGRIDDFKWVSAENVIAPYDFEVLLANSTVPHHVDVKATSGDFGRPIHISLNELRDMANSDSQYDLYRLSAVGPEDADLRVCEDVRGMARQILSVLAGLPSSVMVDSVAVQPDSLPFGETVRLASEFMDDLLRPTGS